MGGFPVDVLDVQRLVVHPGEILAVHLPRETTVEQAQFVSEKIRASLPDGVKVLVISGDIRLEVVQHDN